MNQPDFLVRSVDGTLRAYTGNGTRLPMPEVVAAAWAAEPDACVMMLVPEPLQVDGCRAAEATHRARQRQIPAADGWA